MAVSSSARGTRRRLGWVDPLGLFALAMMITALYLSFVVAPTESLQGVHQRIFYVHVPSALAAYLAFTLVFVGSLLYLWRRNPKWDRLARTAAEVGVIATTLVLITGSLWGKPVWGAYWSWADARLVTTLVLWLIYIAYLMLRSLGGPGPRVARFAAVLGILGFANVPITYLSVFLWNFLHPRSINPLDLPDAFMPPFFVGLIAFTALYGYLMRLRMQLDTDSEQLNLLREELEQ